ncbi:uncharacterized protein [Nicotiana tomentosiformis]|uniref:uncharacterized protein n=1 Tax=Nicotiana tomentosiformis TaxID=4098 RepID=UPI00388CBD1E
MSIEHDDVESNEISVLSSLKRRKTTSVMWNFYEQMPLDTNPDNRLRSKCKICGILFLANSRAGTTNLKRHLAKHEIEASKQACNNSKEEDNAIDVEKIVATLSKSLNLG